MKNRINALAFMALALGGGAPLIDDSIKRNVSKNSNNPHGYPAFKFGDMVIYAVNEAAAQAKYDKIMKKKHGQKPTDDRAPSDIVGDML